MSGSWAGPGRRLQESMKELEACQVLVPEAVRVSVHSCFLLSLDTPVAHTRLYRMSLAVSSSADAIFSGYVSLCECALSS